MSRIHLLSTVCAMWLTTFTGVGVAAPPLSAKASLGKKLFFNVQLSDPNGQSCASCHSPNAGFAEPDKQYPVSEGVLPGRFGSRNAPTADIDVECVPLIAGVGDSLVLGTLGQRDDGELIDPRLQSCE